MSLVHPTDEPSSLTNLVTTYYYLKDCLKERYYPSKVDIIHAIPPHEIPRHSIPPYLFCLYKLTFSQDKSKTTRDNPLHYWLDTDPTQVAKYLT